MCPHCDSDSIRRSRTTKIRDVFMRWIDMRPYRCRDCSRRFYVPKQTDEKLRREREARKAAESVAAVRDSASL